jgi:transposase-like protein
MPAAKPPEFRRRALDLVAQGEPVARVAKDLGISESCLRRWMEQDAVDGGRKEGLASKEGLTSTERRELVELRRRNRVLEMEIEILKRASAYFARENILPKQ